MILCYDQGPEGFDIPWYGVETTPCNRATVVLHCCTRATLAYLTLIARILAPNRVSVLYSPALHTNIYLGLIPSYVAPKRAYRVTVLVIALLYSNTYLSLFPKLIGPEAGTVQTLLVPHCCTLHICLIPIKLASKFYVPGRG